MMLVIRILIDDKIILAKKVSLVIVRNRRTWELAAILMNTSVLYHALDAYARYNTHT